MKKSRAEYAKTKAPWVPRVKQPSEPTPPDYDLFKRPVYDGAELRPFTLRPGALDAFTHPSLGAPT